MSQCFHPAWDSLHFLALVDSFPQGSFQLLSFQIFSLVRGSPVEAVSGPRDGGTGSGSPDVVARGGALCCEPS